MESNTNPALNDPDLPAKYQKLATEYSKLRAQNHVLRKAIVEEQGKSAVLKDDLQTRDQSMRKSEQEIDSLTFRNVQLEKRVGFLQEELSTAVKKYKDKGKKLSTSSTEGLASPDAQPSLGVVDHELLAKIEENMHLHNKISTMEEQHRVEVENLRREVQAASKNDVIQQFQARVEQLENEKSSLNTSLQNRKDEIEAYKDQVQLLQEKIRCLTAASEQNNISRSESHHSNITGGDAEREGDNVDPAEKLEKLLQERERLLLEYQLLKLRHSKTTMKLEEAKQIIKSLGQPNIFSEESTPCVENFEFTTLLGTLDIVSQDLENNGSIYKTEIKEYLTKRINELVCLLQAADSKAVTYYLECKSLQNLLGICGDKIKNMESLIAHNQTRYNDLEDELQRTKSNYESQLTAMTEHLAALNDTLTVQREQIDELTHEVTQNPGKSKKK